MERLADTIVAARGIADDADDDEAADRSSRSVLVVVNSIALLICVAAAVK